MKAIATIHYDTGDKFKMVKFSILYDDDDDDNVDDFTFVYGHGTVSYFFSYTRTSACNSEIHACRWQP